MNLTEIRNAERAALCETLSEVGPAAPTLCASWTAADLAGHLVVSERYWGLPLVVAYPLRRVLPARIRDRGMAAMQAIGERQIEVLGRRGWDWLLGRLGAGPPALYRFGSVAPIRLIEEWIHHEDVRRANGMGVRETSSALNEALWQAALFLTRLPELLPGREGLEVRLPDGRSHRIGEATRVRIEGQAGELLLFLAGRTKNANVDVFGEDDAVQQLTAHLAV